MERLGLLVKRCAMSMGLDVRAYTPARSEAARLATLLTNHRIDLVVDVGANTGQFVRHLRLIGYRGRVICFEPLTAAFASLTRYAARDHNMLVAPRMALGDRNGDVSINVAANSESSSLLKASAVHVAAESSVMPVGSETVSIRRLDDVVAGHLSGDERIFLKIDVQGHELAVLRGAAELLPKLTGLQLELSLEPLYEGEPLYREMIGYVESAGLELYDLTPCFSDNSTGKTYQLDGIFFRK
jgi:FkbM family methyltransferase